jgi:hypothetical protein
LEQQQPTQAVAIFRLNVVLYPHYDSLAEKLEATGDRVGALKNYRRSLELNQADTNAKTHIDGLQGK